MEYFVFLGYRSLIHLKMCGQRYGRRVIKQVTFRKSAADAQRDKSMYSYYHSFKKSVKLKRKFSGVWSQSRHQEKTLTPCYCDSYSLVSTHGCLQAQTRGDKWASQLHDTFCLPGTAQVPVEKGCQSLYMIRNCFLFQDLIHKRAFQFFSKKHFPFKETLKFEL